jgi:hypothetical protein
MKMKIRVCGIFLACVMLWNVCSNSFFVFFFFFWWRYGHRYWCLRGSGVCTRRSRNGFFMLSLFSDCKIEVSLQNSIQLCAFPFMYVIILAWRWSFGVETCWQIKNITFTGCVEYSWFLLLFYCYLTTRQSGVYNFFF